MSHNSFIATRNELENEMATRFSKSAMLAELQRRESMIQKNNGFTSSTGTAQLWPRGCSDEIKALISRAAEYGRFVAMQEIQRTIEDGRI